MDRRQPQVARPRALAALRLQFVEEGETSGASIGQHQRRRRLAQALLREPQQQPERVAVRGDRVRAGPALPHQPLGEEPFEQWGEAGSWPRLPATPPRRASAREQLGRGAEIPVGAARTDVAEIGRQREQAALGIDTRAVPVAQGLHREGVAEIRRMRAGAPILCRGMRLSLNARTRAWKFWTCIRAPTPETKKLELRRRGQRQSRRAM